MNSIAFFHVHRGHRISEIVRTYDPSAEVADCLQRADVDGDGTLTIEDILLTLAQKVKAEKKNRNLMKVIGLCVVGLFVLAGTTLTTSIIAVRLSKEVEVSANGRLVNAATKEEVATKSVVVAEYFWLYARTKEEIASEIEAENKSAVVVGRGCADTHQVDSLITAAVEGTPSITGFASLNSNEEAVIELSSNANTMNDTVCVESRDGVHRICFHYDEGCFDDEESRRRLVNMGIASRLGNSNCHKRRLSETGIVARKLCENAGSTGRVNTGGSSGGSNQGSSAASRRPGRVPVSVVVNGNPESCSVNNDIRFMRC